MQTWQRARSAGPVGSLILVLAAALAGCGEAGERVGGFSNDLTGNEIVITAIADPKVPGVVCHFVSFDRSLIDRISQGNAFENPSNTAISCEASVPVDPEVLERLPRSEEVFSQGASLLFKATAVRRVVDRPNRSLVYVSYARELVGASAKIDLSVVRVPAETSSTAAAAPTPAVP